MSLNLESDFDRPCEIVTRKPDRRTGPMVLRLAVRCIVDHRPLAEEVEIRTADGEVIGEAEIEALYALARLPGSPVTIGAPDRRGTTGAVAPISFAGNGSERRWPRRP